MSSDVTVTWQLENWVTWASMSLEKKKERECNMEHSQNQGHLGVMDLNSKTPIWTAETVMNISL